MRPLRACHLLSRPFSNCGWPAGRPRIALKSDNGALKSAFVSKEDGQQPGGTRAPLNRRIAALNGPSAILSAIYPGFRCY